MNKMVTSREEILSESRRLVIENGIAAINIRTVAKRCNVAVGSIYNYFPSKTELICASVEAVWKDIFHISGNMSAFAHFTDCLKWLYESIQKGRLKYPGFFTLHSMSFTSADKEMGRQMMEQYFGHMKQNLKQVLQQDKDVIPDAFSGNLSEDEFIEMILTLLISMLLREKDNCEPLISMAESCIYSQTRLK